MKNTIVLFLKGMLMGICDIIPGISGGTIAFITGIYSRLINAVKGFSFELIKDFFNFIYKRDKKSWNVMVKRIDLVFLITLGAGIGTALLLMSRVISFLLENFFNLTISFFIGLILASSKVIYNKIENHKIKNISFGLLGLTIGIVLAIITPASITPNLLFVFFAGFLAISAMFLPGISGAFILLILGVYEFMLKVLHDLKENIEYFLVFGVGAALGAFTISRIISFLFKKDKCKTLYFLLGLVLGSLSIPIKRIYESTSNWSINGILFMVLFLVAGILIVGFINKFDKDDNKA